MFRDLWQARIDGVKDQAQHIHAEMKKLERTIGQTIDRLVEAGSDTLIKA